MNIAPGRSGTVEMQVSEADTALAMRTGEVAVLSTPRLIALCEEATMVCLDGSAEEGCSSVGVRVLVDHVAPTAVGRTVVAEATIDKVEGRRVIFNVSARDERGLVAAGKVTRVMVDLERFMEKAR